MIDHDLLNAKYMPTICYYLVTPALKYLDIYGSSQIDDEFIVKLALIGAQFESIRLIRCIRLSDKGLAELLLNQCELQHLELRWLTIDGYCLTKLLSPKLRSLDLKGCSNLTADHVLTCIKNHSSKLKSLNLRGLRKLNSTVISQIADCLSTSVEDLNLSECINLGDEGLINLAPHCKNVKTLRLTDCMNVTENGVLKLLQYAQQVVKLDLSFCARNGTIGMKLLDNIPCTIQILTLFGLELHNVNESSFVNAMEKLPNLQYLSLNGLSILSDTLLHKLLSSIGFQLLKLDLSGSFNKFTDDALRWVAEFCTQLQNFGLSLLSNLTGIELLPMFQNPKRASQLETLLVANCVAFNDELLSAIFENCTSLRIFEGSGIGTIQDHHISLLSDHAENLEALYLKGNRSLSDLSIEALASKALKLRTISLSGNPRITDRSLFSLATSCHSLQEIYLSGCMVSVMYKIK